MHPVPFWCHFQAPSSPPSFLSRLPFSRGFTSHKLSYPLWTRGHHLSVSSSGHSPVLVTYVSLPKTEISVLELLKLQSPWPYSRPSHLDQRRQHTWAIAEEFASKCLAAIARPEEMLQKTTYETSINLKDVILLCNWGFLSLSLSLGQISTRDLYVSLW